MSAGSKRTRPTPSCGCSGKSTSRVSAVGGKNKSPPKSYGASEADISCISVARSNPLLSGQLIGPCAAPICEDVLENPHYYTHDSRYITACHQHQLATTVPLVRPVTSTTITRVNSVQPVATPVPVVVPMPAVAPVSAVAPVATYGKSPRRRHKDADDHMSRSPRITYKSRRSPSPSYGRQRSPIATSAVRGSGRISSPRKIVESPRRDTEGSPFRSSGYFSHRNMSPGSPYANRYYGAPRSPNDRPRDSKGRFLPMNHQ